jgi:hypothetical protein
LLYLCCSTKGSGAHPNQSIFNDIEGGNTLRAKGNRLEKMADGSWIDPGVDKSKSPYNNKC